MILKRQRFGDSGSDKMELRGSKYQHLDERDNKEGNGLDNKEGKDLDKDEDEIEGDGYVPPPFIPLPFLFQKVSNRLSDLSKRIKSLKHIICISKICYLRYTNFALEFPGKRSSKT